MKPRITSTVIISVLVLINLFFFLSVIAPLNLADVVGDPLPEKPGEVALIWGGLAVGVAIAAFAGWALSIAVTHAICLIFTIKNRHSTLKAVRIINVVLDVANAVLIVGPIIKIISW
jgi:hypothetical protein